MVPEAAVAVAGGVGKPGCSCCCPGSGSALRDPRLLMELPVSLLWMPVAH